MKQIDFIEKMEKYNYNTKLNEDMFNFVKLVVLVSDRNAILVKIEFKIKDGFEIDFIEKIMVREGTDLEPIREYAHDVFVDALNSILEKYIQGFISEMSLDYEIVGEDEYLFFLKD